MMLLNAHTHNLNIFIDIESSVFERLLSTCHRATINGHNDFASLGLFNHPADMSSNSCKTKKPSYAILSQLYTRLISNLAHI